MERAPIQKAAMLFGVVFAVIAIGGVIPGVTTDYDRLTEIGGVGAKELGFIGVNILEVVAHALYAVAGFALARSVSGSRAYFLGGGAIYIVLWIYGLLIDVNSSANIIGVNEAANWVHFLLGVVMLGVGMTLGRPAVPARTA